MKRKAELEMTVKLMQEFKAKVQHDEPCTKNYERVSFDINNLLLKNMLNQISTSKQACDFNGSSTEVLERMQMLDLEK